MSALQDAFTKARSWHTHVNFDAIEAYVFGGNDAALAKVMPQGGEYWASGIAGALRRPNLWENEDRRTVHVLAKVGAHDYLWGVLEAALVTEEEGETLHEAFCRELKGTSPGEVAGHTLARLTRFTRDGGPTSAGRYVLGLKDKVIREAAGLMEQVGSGIRLMPSTKPLAELLLDHAPERVEPLLDVLLKRRSPYDARVEVFEALLKRGNGKYESKVVAEFEEEPDSWKKFQQGVELHAFNPEKYGGKALEAARKSLRGGSGSNNHGPVGEWMIQHFGRAVLPDLVAYMESSEQAHWAKDILSAAVKAFGREAIPVLHGALKAKIAKPSPYQRLNEEDIRQVAIGHLIALGDEAQDDRIEEAIKQGLLMDQAQVVINYMGLAGKWKPARLQEHLWTLMEHKSKTVRDAAASALARAGEEAVKRGAKLLEHKKAEVRLAAARLLTLAGTDPATAALESRVDVEANEDVRDQMLKGLEEAWAKQGRKVTKKEIAARIDRAEASGKLSEPPAKWVQVSALPPVKWKDGKALTEKEARYLLFRQSRAREMRADVEVKPMVALLDRESAGEFAAALVKGFIAAGADAKDRWALSAAGLLGDDRLVPVLAGKIRDWVDENRGKLAEYTVEALALMGTDAALLAVDAMAIRYRSKMKNVGKAAAEAFGRAAEELGISPDELGDRVVPWLGFVPGKPWIVEAGTGKYEVRIGLDMKLGYFDLVKNKPAKSLPKSAPAEVLAELKETAANLREVTKGQLLRLENLLVRQRRWPAKRWQELFLGHPLLLPFAARLVWGEYAPDGKLRGMFRGLEDRSLTTREDDTYALGDDGQVGMIHPLEISEEERQAWLNHLADYEIEPPFAQMEREVVQVLEQEKGLRSYKKLEKKSINAMTFKGRAERLGWHRGSVVDGGGIVGYYKSFPAAGVDIYLFVEGMYMGIDMYSNIELGQAMFFRSGTVQMGSYVYDEPRDENDPRVVAFGDVPAIVFSESMGDLQKIAGGPADAET